MTEENKEWKGYTFDELKYKRLVSETRIEIAMNNLTRDVKAYHSSRAAATSMLTRMMGALNYIDYSVIAFRVGKRLLSMLRRR